MNKFVVRTSVVALAAQLALFTQQAYAETPTTGLPYGLGLETLSVAYQHFRDARDPYTPEFDNQYVYRVSANFRVSLARVLYWENDVHTEALQGEVKTVGWHYVVGLRVSPAVEAFYEHHSRHVMEEGRADRDGRNVFPVEDSFGVRFRFFTDDRKRFLFGGE